MNTNDVRTANSNSNANGDAATDWIPVKEAARLLPSCRPGKRLHVSTIYRWIDRKVLDAWKVGRWTFVRRAKVLELIQPLAVAEPRREKRPDREAVRESDRERENFTRRVFAEVGYGSSPSHGPPN